MIYAILCEPRTEMAAISGAALMWLQLGCEALGFVMETRNALKYNIILHVRRLDSLERWHQPVLQFWAEQFGMLWS